MLGADENRLTQPQILIGNGGANDLLLLALGKNHPFGVLLGFVHDDLYRAGGRVKPRFQAVLIGLHIDNRRTRHTAIHGGACHGRRNFADQARVKRHRNNIARAKARALAIIGSGHFIGDIFTRQHGQSLGAGNFHRIINGGGAHIQSAAENIRKAQNIIDLIGIIRASGRHNGIVANGGNFFRCNLRIGIGHGKNNRLIGHGFNHILGHGAFDRQAQKHIRPIHRIGQAARFRVSGMGRFPLVHALFAALINDPFCVA